MTITAKGLKVYKGLLARKKLLDKRVEQQKKEIKGELEDNEEVMIGDYIVVKKVTFQHNLDKDKLAILVKERHKIDILSIIVECKNPSRRETLSVE